MRTVMLLALLVLVVMTGFLARTVEDLGELIDLQSTRMIAIEAELMEVGDFADRFAPLEEAMVVLHMKVDYIHNDDLALIIKALAPIIEPEMQRQNGEPHDYDRRSRTYEIQVHEEDDAGH